jgi:hypothetical protein
MHGQSFTRAGTAFEAAMRCREKGPSLPPYSLPSGVTRQLHCFLTYCSVRARVAVSGIQVPVPDAVLLPVRDCYATRVQQQYRLH